MTAPPFVGWQRQDNGLSVQEALEDGGAQLLRRARDACIGAGRTDAGVHALGQVAHLDLRARRRRHGPRCALNFHLKPHPARAARCGWRRPISTRGSRPWSGAIATASSTAARRWRWSGTASGTSAPARRRRHARGRAASGRPSRFHHLPRRRLPGEFAGEDARRARRSRAATRSSDGARALLPASPGAQHGRHAEAGGRRQMDAAKCPRPLAARDRAAAGPTAPAEGSISWT